MHSSTNYQLSTHETGVLVILIKEIAKSRNVTLSDQQISFARDLLTGYYEHGPNEQNANVVWLRIPKDSKQDFNSVFKLVTEFLDPDHGIEYLNFDSYLTTEPSSLEQKVRRRRQHIVALDDFNKLFVAHSDSAQHGRQLSSVDKYWTWIAENAPGYMTLFVIDEDGSVIRDPAFSHHLRVNYLGADDCGFTLRTH